MRPARHSVFAPDQGRLNESGVHGDSPVKNGIRNRERTSAMGNQSGGIVVRLGAVAALVAALVAGCNQAEAPQALDEISAPAKGSGGGEGSGGGGGGGLSPLSSVAVPQSVGGDVVDRAAAVRLGKALYWDVPTGGDGLIARASCHFHAGTDNRMMNVVNPGPDGLFTSGGVTGPGQLFSPSAILDDDRVGSQGIVGAMFAGVDPDPSHAADLCTPDQGTPFYGHRRVTGRNAPPTLGAVFNRDNFWDGRANHGF